MNRFSQFEIKTPERGFEGDKIKITRIVNREIVVHDYKVVDSTVKAFQEKGSGKCLHLQISFNNELHVIFTAASALIEVIQQIPREKLPFITTIVQENDRYKFT
jgi:hypothetical protein